MMVNVTLQPSWEQISFFVQERTGIPAKSLFDGSEYDAFAPSEFMKRLVPEGEYVVMIGSHPLVLRPTKLNASEVPEGHQFYHFEIENTIYSGVFIGEET